MMRSSNVGTHQIQGTVFSDKRAGQLKTSTRVFLGEHTTLLSFRPEQSLWQRHGCTRGSTDASKLLTAAPPGPHRSMQSSRTQSNHGKRSSSYSYERFLGKTMCFFTLSYSFLLLSTLLSKLIKFSLLPSI